MYVAFSDWSVLWQKIGQKRRTKKGNFGCLAFSYFHSCRGVYSVDGQGFCIPKPCFAHPFCVSSLLLWIWRQSAATAPQPGKNECNSKDTKNQGGPNPVFSKPRFSREFLHPLRCAPRTHSGSKTAWFPRALSILGKGLQRCLCRSCSDL